ncbi:hypothetical protein EK21DRAFT_53067 [Setomelanomma holmii]|uniref:HTH CENPB-type domain-containing protein n=1 Tax=Setomelanomma holmii TaxID=210430 RepID=A0A9P4HMU4_9PLEO|nr:hypothetical protein EK21DRAFT_53067 [Setomelanomma holmii]
MADIEAALAALELLKPGDRFTYTYCANKYNCNHSTLSKRHRGVQEARATKLANGRLLNNAHERQLVQYIHDLVGRGLPPSRPMIRNFAQEISQQHGGKNWTDRFVKRHQN